MRSFPVKRRISLLILFCFCLTVALIALDSQAVFIQSEESKTPNDEPVFNRIRWFHQGDRDIWMMQQSFHGEAAASGQWDRLAIVVDNSVSPRRARFYQLASGDLEWKENPEIKPNRVACYICHSNGPRGIRPEKASVLDRIKIFMWNLRIKTYGRVILDPFHDATDAELRTPVRWRGTYENEPLQVRVCARCHNESGLFARGSLRRQNIPTIRFMLEAGHMPPLGFSISPSERSKLNKFVAGF